MSLFDKLFRHALPPMLLRHALPPAPGALDVSWEPGRVLCPVDGTVVELADVPDPVFSMGMMGPGTAFEPLSDNVFSPVTGIVNAMVGSGHAFHLITDDGLEVLVHVGIDSVVLHGRGFVPRVAQGEHVDAGTTLVTFDRSVLCDAGFSDVVVVTLPNAPELVTYTLLVDGGDAVVAGDVVMSAVSHQVADVS